LLQLSSVFGDFLEVAADLLAVLKDFLFAGAVTDIPPELGSIFSQQKKFDISPGPAL
jgi:hypothetical protein